MTAAKTHMTNYRRTSALFVTVTLATFCTAVALALSPTFTLVPAPMTKPRTDHTATLLNTGQVLIAGGWNDSAEEASAELYDPAAGKFTATEGPMTEARSGHTATLLSASPSTTYAKVLIVGSGEADVTAELYNPATRLFARTGSMTHARLGATATRLNNGKVLIVGGNTTAGDKTAELYNPATGTFSVTGSTSVLRTGHTATLLQDGTVLIAGGSVSTGPTATAERYNPETGKFTPTGNMTIARSGHTATRLGAHDGTDGGEVLIAGSDITADLYNPAKGTFTAVGGAGTYDNPGISRTASLRNDGTVLIAGGYVMESVHVLREHNGGGWTCVNVGELPVSGLYPSALFSPSSDDFTVASYLNVKRSEHAATVLPDGSVLITGGINHTVSPRQYFAPCTRTYPEEIATVLSSAELYK
jgi:hypothetical protein